jgi:hypothetical protein
MGLGGQRHVLATLTPGKEPVPLYRRIGGPLGRSVRVGKILPSLEFDPWTAQPLASRYTDWAVVTVSSSG